MAYNLSITQKEVLRSLVPLPTTSLAIVWSFGGPEIIGFDASKTELPESLTISMLRSLDRLGLISLREGPQPNYCEVEVLQDAIDLVLNDFRETAVSQPTHSNKEEAALLAAMDSLFKEGDIQELCFGMGLDYENIPGQTKRARILALIGETKRQGRLLNLVARVIDARPRHNWIDSLG